MATNIDRPTSEAERILLRHREEVAQVTERAGRDLRRLGIDDSEVIKQLLVGDPARRTDPVAQGVEAAVDRAADRLMARLELRYG